MKLANSKYETLKKDSVIDINIKILTGVVMNEPHWGFIDATKPGVYVMGVNRGIPAGTPKSPESRVSSQQDEEEYDLAWINSEVALAKKLLAGRRFFHDVMGINKDQLEKGLNTLEWIKRRYDEYYSGTHGRNWKRDMYLGAIIIRLGELGCIRARRVDFIYKLFLEHNFDGVKDNLKTGHTVQRKVRDIIRQVDQEAMKLYRPG